MAHYIVGDLQGCATELKQLLAQVNFNPKLDSLWCVGDLVARGPASLECLQVIRDLGNAAKVVLGNHDLNLLAVILGVRSAHPSDRLQAILDLPKTEQLEWLDWLRQQPLMRQHQNLVISHAGVYPWWSIAKAQALALEVENQLQQADHAELTELFEKMYGNTPNRWDDDLTGVERTRFIINAFTRMRYVEADGALNFSFKGPPHSRHRPQQLVPWFELWPVTEQTLVFGHWAALHGETLRDDVIGLDTGCVWGQQLTLMRWPDGQRYQAEAIVRAN